MQVAALISDQRHYEAGAKPMIALVHARRTPEHLFYGLVFHAGSEVTEFLSGKPGEWGVAGDLQSAESSLRKFDVEWILTDDYLPRLEFGLKLSKRLGVRHATFVHILYGIQALNPSLRAEQNAAGFWGATVSRYVPFGVLSSRYRIALQRSDLVIANSRFTARTLNTLYSQRADCVAYPPIDATIFNPQTNYPVLEKKYPLVYLGGRGEVPGSEMARMARLLWLLNIRTCSVFGDRRAAELWRRNYPGTTIARFELSDYELSQLYRSATFTLLPDTWEDFGNVGPESLLCGTPVILSGYQPWLEIVGPGSHARYIDSLATDRVRSDSERIEVEPSDLSGAITNLRLELSPDRFSERILDGMGRVEGSRGRTAPQL